jgi:hypothetical protein
MVAASKTATLKIISKLKALLGAGQTPRFGLRRLYVHQADALRPKRWLCQRFSVISTFRLTKFCHRAGHEAGSLSKD